MNISDLTPEVLAALRVPRQYPAITMVLPADPKDPFGEKSRILVRDLCTEAKRRLEDDPDVDRGSWLELRDERLVPDHIERLIDPAEPGHQLVIYVNAHEPTQIWHVPAPPDTVPRVEFGDVFLTRYLVAAEQRCQPYLVLVLDQEMCRLYLGADHRLTEVDKHGFPAPPQIPSPEDALPGAIPRSAPYEGHEAYVKQYLRVVDADLGKALKAYDGPPLFVVGGDKILAAFLELTGHKDVIVGTLQLTGMDHDSPSDLAKRVAPLLDDLRSQRVAEADGELDTARSQGKYAGGAADVWTAVADKRVHRLIVEEGLLLAGRILDDGRKFDSAPFPEPITLSDPVEDVAPPAPGIATDIVERLVEDVAESSARVLFVPDGTLADAGGVAAVLRY